MNLAAFLECLKSQGIRLSSKEDRLVIEAPAGVLTPELKAELACRKREVLDLLRSQRVTPPGKEQLLAAQRETNPRRQGVLTLADALIGESEGRRPPPNPTVHRMFDEARARVGHRDLEERSITASLRKYAPEVAARWIDAPVTASWFDWRLHVGREHLDALDRAFEAVNPKLDRPKTGCERP